METRLFVFIVRRLVPCEVHEAVSVIDNKPLRPSTKDEDEVVRIVSGTSKEDATKAAEASMQGLGFAYFRWHCVEEMRRETVLGLLRPFAEGSKLTEAIPTAAALRYAALEFGDVIGETGVAALRDAEDAIVRNALGPFAEAVEALP